MEEEKQSNVRKIKNLSGNNLKAWLIGIGTTQLINYTANDLEFLPCAYYYYTLWNSCITYNCIVSEDKVLAIKTAFWQFLYPCCTAGAWLLQKSCWTWVDLLLPELVHGAQVAAEQRRILPWQNLVILWNSIQPQNQWIIWVGRDLKNSPPWAGIPSPWPGSSKLHPAWPWTLAGMGHPQLL